MPTSITVAPGSTKSRRDHSGRADGGDENVGAAADLGQVACLRMADGHGGISVQQQHCHGLADDVAAADDHGFRSGNRNLLRLSISMTPAGVHGTRPGRCVER